MKKLNIVMAWWWTWWHVFPIKSLIEYISKKEEFLEKINKIYRFWEKKSLEKEIFSQIQWIYPKLFFQNIISWKYRRETRLKSRLKNIRDLFKFVFWILQSIYYIIVYKIDVVFCKWWYVALPVVLAAKLLRKRIIVHESDVKPWLVNKIAAKYANAIFTWFDGVFTKATTVWQILSDEIISKENTKNFPMEKLENENLRTLTIKEQLFYTDPEKTHLLLMWGSQWSQRLYKKFLESMKLNKEIYKDYEIFIILWKENQEMIDDFDLFKNVHVYKFVSQKDMWLLLKNCDISLTRAWTTSLAEHKLYNLKIVMVPIPRTHDQYDNAKFYQKTHWDILLDSKDPNYFQNMIEIFKKYKNFKKSDVFEDLYVKISDTKDKIIKSIIQRQD